MLVDPDQSCVQPLVKEQAAFWSADRIYSCSSSGVSMRREEGVGKAEWMSHARTRRGTDGSARAGTFLAARKLSVGLQRGQDTWNMCVSREVLIGYCQAEAAVWPRGWAHGRARAPPDVLPPTALLHHAAGRRSRRPPPAATIPGKTQCHLGCKGRELKEIVAVTKKHAVKSEFGVKKRLIDT